MQNPGSGLFGFDEENNALNNSPFGEGAGEFNSGSQSDIESFRRTVEQFGSLSRSEISASNQAALESVSLLENGDFEAGALVNGQQFYSEEEIPGWTSSNADGAQALRVVETFRRGEATRALELDTTGDQDDRIYQEVLTEIGAKYVLTFDFRGRDGTSRLTNDFRVVWDGQFQGRFVGHDIWQSGSLELTATRTGFTKLFFNELREDGEIGGDGSGPLLDNIRLVRVHSELLGNGSFENVANESAALHDPDDVPGWGSNSRLKIVERNWAPDRGRVLELDTSSDIADRFSQRVDVEENRRYLLTFDAKGRETFGDEDNEFRVRWNNEFVGSFRGEQRWNTYSVVLNSHSDGLGRLVFREPGNDGGNGKGPFIDNIRLFELETNETGFLIQEDSRFVSERLFDVELGTSDGLQRIISFRVDTEFDTTSASQISDLFNAYIVADNNPSQFLLTNEDRSLLGISETGESNFLLGDVTFNGNTVRIDASAISEAGDGKLLLQLLNHDLDDDSLINVSDIQSNLEPDEEDFQLPAIQSQVSNIGPEVDLNQLNEATEVSLKYENVVFNSTTGIYSATAKLRNNGEAIGRNVVALFENLPAGITLDGISGVASDGSPYINFGNAIRNGGLGSNSESGNIRVEFSNPDLIRLSPEVSILADSNSRPVIAPIAPVTLVPGEVHTLQIDASDFNGDNLTYSIGTGNSDVSLRLSAGGEIRLAPKPGQEGSHEIEVIVSDGIASESSILNVDVNADTVSTTRLVGSVFGTNGNPLVGLRLSVGNVEAITNSSGQFVLESAELGDSKVLIHGDEIVTGDGSFYPFLEKEPAFFLGQPLFEGALNTIAEPIFLPELSEEDTVEIVPNQTTVVSSMNLPEVTLEIAANSAMDANGDLLSGNIGVMEVPIGLTPRELPSHLTPDKVYAVFTTNTSSVEFEIPALLTVPNSGGFAPGSEMNLWAVDPEVDEFRVVGKGRVSDDGELIEPIAGQGGVIHGIGGDSSVNWRVYVPSFGSVNDDSGDDGCEKCVAAAQVSSEVNLSNGAYYESHNLVSYQSLGQSRGLTLHYDSLRANPSKIVSFSLNEEPLIVHIDEVDSVLESTPMIGARLSVFNENLEIEIAGNSINSPGQPSHFWMIPDTSVERVSANAFFDASNLATGIYQYQLEAGVYRELDGELSGAAETSNGDFLVVNSHDSPFGVGWGIGGVRKISEFDNGDVIVEDGDGTELRFTLAENDVYESPVGDFSVLVKTVDGWERTFTDGTTSTFDGLGRLTESADRNDNVTSYSYNEIGIDSISDPVGQTTTFNYADNRVSSIQDPSGQLTRFFYDSDGNLTLVVDPDESQRHWLYDDRHLIVEERTKRGFVERNTYDEFGRVESSQSRDGNVVDIRYSKSFGTAGSNTNESPNVSTAEAILGFIVDENGNVFQHELDSTGQLIQTVDATGNSSRIVRGQNNLAEIIVNGRGNETRYRYDELGNLLSISDQIDRRELGNGTLFPGLVNPVEGANSVVAGDFNGDGVTDLALANVLSDEVSVLLGIGDGTFTEEQLFDAGRRPRSITSGDFDGDRVTDLVVANSIDGFVGVSVLLGHGNGTFAAPIEFSWNSPGIFITRSVSLAIGDFNSDGLTDVAAAADSLLDEFSVLLGAGDGSFSEQLRFDLNQNRDPESITAEDFNGDGIVDLATADAGSGSISVLLGQGNAEFSTPLQFAVGDGPSFISSTDVNGDGIDDLTTANSFSNDVSVLLGQGDGLFESQLRFAVGEGPEAIITGDFNNDGAIDMAVANTHSDDVTVLIGEGNGSFSEGNQFLVGASGTGPNSINIGDFDNDGEFDLVTSNGGSVFVLPGLGNGSFTAQLRFDVGSAPRSVTTGDFDSDGVADLAVANDQSDDVSILLGIGNGEFTEQLQFQVGGSPRSITSGDFNGDGITDLATANFDSVDISVLTGIGDGTFGVEQRLDVSSAPRAITTGDFDGDGVSDLATANELSDEVSILRGIGNGTFSEQQRISVGNAPRSITIGDFNADGLKDLATANAFSDDISVLLGLGNGLFAEQLRFFAGDGLSSLTTGDFNEDGVVDLAAANSTPRDVTVLLGIGDGTFDSTSQFDLGEIPRSIATADLNGDGIADLATANQGPFGGVSVLLGIGNGEFEVPFNFATGSDPQSVAVEDLNGDGVNDLITANLSSDNVSVLLGIGNQATPIHPREFTYEPVFNQLTSSTDELGRQTLYEVDPANGNTLSITRVVGLLDTASEENDDVITRYTYNSRGLVKTITDPLGRVTAYDYNEFGNLIQLTFAVGTEDEAFQTFRYDGAGNQTRFTDENGNLTRYVYDPLNRLTRIIEADPDGEGPLESPITRFLYDEAGNLIETVNAEQTRTRNEFDAMDRLVATIDDLGNTTRYEYDSSGNLLAVIDPLGHTTTNIYDARDRLIETIDAEGGSTRFEYDLDDNLRAVIDPVENRTEFVYDARSRLIQEIDPLSNSTFYEYDSTDNLIQKTDRNERITELRYDDLDRLVEEVWLSADGEEVNRIDYEYDLVGNLLSAVDFQSSLSFEYDHRDRVLQTSNEGTPDAPVAVLDYTYDGVGNVISVADTIDGVAGATTNYDFDALNRNITITQNGNEVSDKRVDFGYNQLGQASSIDRYSDLIGNSFVANTSYQYDAANRVQEINHSNLDETFSFFHFTYDQSSRPSSIDDTNGLTRFSFDRGNQLVGADREDGDIRGDEFYQYDSNGNRTASHLHDSSYVTDVGNRLASDGENTYEYDREGNTIRRIASDGSYREFEYDHRNRLTRIIETNSGTVSHRTENIYDVSNRRIQFGNDLNVEIVSFIYDRQHAIVQSNQTSSIRSLFGQGIDQLVALERSTREVQWVAADHLGSIAALISEDGILTQAYSSFGESGSQLNSSIGFTGREYDELSGLYYYRARFFDSSIGRFLSEDTFGFGGGDANRYRYVSNRPLSFNDPSGNVMQCVLTCTGITTVVGVLTGINLFGLPIGLFVCPFVCPETTSQDADVVPNLPESSPSSLDEILNDVPGIEIGPDIDFNGPFCAA